MPPVFSMSIEGFGDLPVMVPFVPKVTINKRPNGDVQSQLVRWPLAGVLTFTDQNDAKAKRNSLIAAFSQPVGKATVKVDGSNFDEISVANGYPRGAFYRNYDVQVTGGEWVALLQYEAEVFGEKDLLIEGVLEADYETEESADENGEERFVVTATARGPGAETWVLSQKPSGTKSFVIRASTQRDVVVGTFTVSRLTTDEVSVEETVTVEPGIFPTEFVVASRSAAPEPLWSGKETTRIVISGTVKAKKGTLVSPPLEKQYAKFLTERPSIARTKPKTAEVLESTTYTITVEIGTKITVAQVLASRAAFGPASYVGAGNELGIKVGAPAGGATTGVPVAGIASAQSIGGGIVVPGVS